jgi:2-phosphoglycerate kinase
MRKFDDSDALHRSSYQGKGDPVNDWLSACHAIDVGLYAVMDDAIKRGQSLVVEGVHIIPSNELIERWNASGGDATGVLIKISNEDAHRDLIFKRGELLKKGAERQLRAFERIRAIQNEMISRAEKYGWGMIEQELLPPAPY